MIPSKHDVTNNESFGAVSVSMHINNWRGLYNEYNQLKSLMSVQLDMHEQIKKLESEIAGAKHQKELSDAREKLLLDVISEMQNVMNGLSSGEDWNNGTHAKIYRPKLYQTLSSVAKKIEGL